MPIKVPKSFEDSFANHPKSAFWSDKNKKKPHEVSKGSGENYLFNCDNPDCGHEFSKGINDINRGRWCPYCTNQQLCDKPDCQNCFDKSFQSVINTLPPDKIWSTNNELTPRQIFKFSGKKFKFNCTNCTHEFEIILGDIKRNRGCNYCASKKLCENTNCQICFDKSFASHYRAEFWSSTNNTKPRNVFKTENKDFNFDCRMCNHTFTAKLYNITCNSSVWCPYCSIPTHKLCVRTDCDWCFSRSFASHPKSEFWSGKNEKKPREVIKCSNDKYLFDCNYCGNEISQSPNRIVCYKRWCNICVNKTEKLMFEFLITLYPNVIKEFKQDWCKYINHLPFDFCIPDHKIIIELDGRQHFVQVSNWKSPEEHQETDIYKMDKAIKNGYSVIRIVQEDVLFDEYDWKNALTETINKLINDKREPTITNLPFTIG